MGSPLDPTWANGFLCYFEQNWFNECPPQFKSVIYSYYVGNLTLKNS